MQPEFKALQDNHTWDIVELPKGKKPIDFKWVCKIKQKSESSVERYKARLVVKGYTQKYGIDFQETFSPVIKMSIVRCIISLAASKKWYLLQLDVDNAIFHGDIHEEVYMKMAE